MCITCGLHKILYNRIKNVEFRIKNCPPEADQPWAEKLKIIKLPLEWWVKGCPSSFNPPPW
jgi:hypothetical protein